MTRVRTGAAKLPPTPTAGPPAGTPLAASAPEASALSPAPLLPLSFEGCARVPIDAIMATATPGSVHLYAGTLRETFGPHGERTHLHVQMTHDLSMSVGTALEAHRHLTAILRSLGVIAP